MTQTAKWPLDALPLGTVLFGYKLDGFLGRGGFGITYRAVDRIDQVFAIKECYPRQFAVRQGMDVQASEDGYAAEMYTKCLEGFTKEALALTRFSHSEAAGEGVIKVITSFETNGTAYIVMEFVAGDSLEDLIKANPGGLPEATLAPIFRNLVNTLGRVHRSGLLHRDIKPANVILRRDGRPVLLDFGAARAARPDGPAPSTIFTETYAPIEQIEGLAQGPFSDLYSLGVTCYQAIAGARFRAAASSTERFRAALRHDADPLVPAARLGAGRYSGALLQAVDLLLRVAPEDRPQSVEAFLPHLDGAGVGTVAVGSGAAIDPDATRVVGSRTGTALNEAVAPAPAAATVVAPQAAGSAAPARGGKGALIGVLALLLAGGVGGGFYWYLNHSGGAGSAPAPALAAPSAPAPQEAAAPPAHEAASATTANLAGASGLAAANQAYEQKDFATALRRYTEAAQAGDAQAQYQVGYMYQLGQGVTADPATALQWYRKSADQNFANAQGQIGYLYQYGVGVPQDYTAATHWYGLAAAQGFKTAQFQLGYLAQHGFGTAKNYETALHWYRLAAQQGSAPAQNQLGYLYQMGYGVRMNYTDAFRWYKAAADQGLATAQYSVGRLYDSGLGVAHDTAAARDWMGRAAAGGNAEARAWLAAH
ncbi:MAG: serine/threonine-protein kinase [Rhodospirillales bacterium]